MTPTLEHFNIFVDSLDRFAIQQTTIAIQIVIVSILAFFCYQGEKDFHFIPLKHQKCAWIFNLAYLSLSVFFDESSKKIYFMGWTSHQLTDFQSLIIRFSIGTLDTISLYYFYLTSRNCLDITKSNVFNSILKIITPKANDKSTIKILFIIDVIILLLKINLVNYSIFQVLYLLIHCYLGFISLYLLFVYLSELEKKIINNHNYLTIGSLLYCVLQLISLTHLLKFDSFHNVYVNNLGFFIGLVSKFLLLVGFYLFIIQSIKDKYKIEEPKNDEVNNINNFYDRIFHEIHKPLDSIIHESKDLSLNEHIFSGKILNKIHTIQHGSLHIQAIISAASKIHESNEYDFDISVLTEADSAKLEIYSINTIIQSAISFLKRRDETGRQPEFKVYYSGNCNMQCVFDDIIRVFLNIIKNAIEAIDQHSKEVPLIIIRTSNKILEDNSRHVVVTIEDNGPGIPLEIQDKIFMEGFSTKKNKKVGHGFGLFICMEIIKKYNGSISFQSPIFNVNGIAKMGTQFIITLPKYFNNER